MSWRLASYTKALRRYDGELFAGRTKDGVPCVFRRIKRWMPITKADGFKLMVLKEDKEFIFALTDTWLATGQPREWGVDHVLSRIREIDTQANEDLIRKWDEQNERVDQSRQRHFDNEAEAFLKDNRRQFVKEMEEIAPMARSLPRNEKRKILRDRRIKNGNY
jgi:hypothetical protein